MEQIHDYDEKCERYLLGESSEQEQIQLEEAYFDDDALFERLRAVKDELIDAYARGDLTGQKRERFEQHFLASEPRRQRVEEARRLIRAVTVASTKAATVDGTNPAYTAASTLWWQSISKLFAGRPLIWQGALAVLLLVALAASWVLVKRFQAQRAERERVQNEDAARKQQEQERGRAAVSPVNSKALPTNPTAIPASEKTPPPKPGDKHPLQPAPAQVASLFLTPFSPREATASNSLVLRSDTREVVLHLAIKEDDYGRYDLLLQTLDGNQVLSRRGLRTSSGASGKNVTLTLDPSIFRNQDYIVTLSGLTAGGRLEAIGDYYFRVEHSVSHIAPTPARK